MINVIGHKKNMVIEEYPPNYHKIKSNFEIGDSKPLFAYSPHIYNPFKIYVDPTLYFHESIHIKQQDGKPEEWWDKYILDKSFRLEQETEANQKQWKLFTKVVKDRNERYRFKIQLAKNMASNLYGNMVSYDEAIKLLNNGE